MNRKSTPALCVIGLATLATAVQAETERQHGAHEHGAAQLTLAAENQTLVVGLDSPAYNLVGFEQAPSNDAQRAQVESALATLARADAVLDLPAAAQCALTGQTVDADHWQGSSAGEDHHDEHDEDHHDDHDDEHDEHEEDHHNDHDQEHDDHSRVHDDHEGHDDGESAHSDVLVEWTYRCDNLDALRTVTVSAFEHFPNLTDLQVQYIGDDWQGATQLTPSSPSLRLN
ncbi:DUF2796 domain-containing protein [Saccharospirillum impatiens]|uniref:DUF2796 domain-containing protein n=1 Tax=Saccharospirillum impatiens TaxID=169438 RepID=UPI0003F5786B|nr:DUF2796 domain-containing protein [Saccharospirillum impatiens]